MQELTERTQQVLLLWRLVLLSEDEFADWLNARVLEMDSLGHMPDWFFTLLDHGPERCLKLSSREFDLPWLGLDFDIRFCARLHRARLESDEELEAFMDWLIRASHGEDVEDPAVTLGYQLDHFAFDEQRMNLALAELRASLPALRQRAEARVAELFAGAGIDPQGYQRSR